jgi:hypothetical protein
MKLTVGCAYAGHSSYAAREIIAIENGRVYYRDFLLEDGQPMSSGQSCVRSVFHRWAVRPCTDSEVARFHRDDVSQEDQMGKALMEAIAAVMKLFQLKTSTQ